MITFDALINSWNESDVRLNINFTASKSKRSCQSSKPCNAEQDTHTHSTGHVHTVGLSVGFR